jgi:hypothetical protein
MSHDRGWRAACVLTIWSLLFHFERLSVARGVTAMVVGSGALLGLWFIRLRHAYLLPQESSVAYESRDGETENHNLKKHHPRELALHHQTYEDVAPVDETSD